MLQMVSYYDKPEKEKHMIAGDLYDAEFRGLSAKLRLCEGARVLLTHNEWVEAGLMNGALGWVRGFVWPEGGDPRSAPSRSRPLFVSL